MGCIFFYPTNEINFLKDRIFVFTDKYSHFTFTCFRGFRTTYFLQNYSNLFQLIFSPFSPILQAWLKYWQNSWKEILTLWFSSWLSHQKSSATKPGFNKPICNQSNYLIFLVWVTSLEPQLKSLQNSSTWQEFLCKHFIIANSAIFLKTFWF